VSRRAVFWTIVALTGALVLAVVGVMIVFSFANAEELLEDAGSGLAAYLTIFGLVFADAIVPIFPGETTLNAASVLASQDKLQLELVMLAGALGAVLGDSTLYWIARTGPRKLKKRLEAASQKDERIEKGLALLGRSGPLLIACGRFVPGVRFAVNVSMGITEYPYRRFLVFSAIGGVAWAVYTCLLAYWVGTALADFPLASVVVSGIVTTVLIVGVYWIDRRRHPDEAGSPPAPAIPTL
jgi:membrane-associated protein